MRKALVVIENITNGKEGYEDNGVEVRVFIRSKPFGSYENENTGFVREPAYGNHVYGNPYIESATATGKCFVTAIEVNDAYFSFMIKSDNTKRAEEIGAPNIIGSRIGGIKISTANNNVNAYGVGTNIRIMGVRE